MYYTIGCYSSLSDQSALIDYTPDNPVGQVFGRNWHKGQRFTTNPPIPIIAKIPSYQAGVVLEMNLSTIPLMTRRLAEVLNSEGVSNIDFYEAEIHYEATGEILKSHLAFNITEVISVANIISIDNVTTDEKMISASFNSLVIDEEKAKGKKIFRLTESLMQIVVRESLKVAIEFAGINTLEFVKLDKWIS